MWSSSILELCNIAVWIQDGLYCGGFHNVVRDWWKVCLVYADSPYQQQRWMRCASRRARWGDSVTDQTLPPLYIQPVKNGLEFPETVNEVFLKENSVILELSQKSRDSLQLRDFSCFLCVRWWGEDLSSEGMIWNWIFLTMALLAGWSECISLPIALFCKCWEVFVAQVSVFGSSSGHEWEGLIDETLELMISKIPTASRTQLRVWEFYRKLSQNIYGKNMMSLVIRINSQPVDY